MSANLKIHLINSLKAEEISEEIMVINKVLLN